MRRVLFVPFLLLCAGLTSCQVLGIDAAGLGVLPASESREFLVTSTSGLVQVRESFDEPWRFLKAGETITTEHYICTGMNATADLVLDDGSDGVKVKVLSNLPETELYDAYQKLLCPNGQAMYLRKKAGKGDCIGKCPIMVCRSSMYPVAGNDLLAVTNVTLDTKNDPFAVGGAAAAGGGTTGGC